MDLKVNDLVVPVRNLTEDDIFLQPEFGYEDEIVVPEGTPGRVIAIEPNQDTEPSVLVAFVSPDSDYEEEWWVGHLIQDGVIIKVVE